MLNDNNYKKDSDSNIYYLDEEKKEYIVSAMKTLNQKQLQEFKEKGFVFIVGNPQNKKEVNGLFDHVKKYIMICVDNRTEDAIVRTFYHEWGHFLDYYWNIISGMPTFKHYFNTYKKNCKKHIKEFYKLNNMQCEKITFLESYEFTSSAEFLAVGYSRYKKNELTSNFMISVCEEMEKD
jgi:hypothetical protein